MACSGFPSTLEYINCSLLHVVTLSDCNRSSVDRLWSLPSTVNTTPYGTVKGSEDAVYGMGDSSAHTVDLRFICPAGDTVYGDGAHPYKYERKYTCVVLVIVSRSLVISTVQRHRYSHCRLIAATCASCRGCRHC